MLGAGNRVCRHEVHAGGQMRRHIAHNGALHRADIGHDRAALEMAGDFPGDLAAGANGNAEDDEIGILDGLRIGLDHGIDNAELRDAGAGLGQAFGGDDFAGQPLFTRRARDRTTDQPKADQRDAIKVRRGVHFDPMKSRRASTTRRLASSVPIVIRSACGRR